MSEPRAVATGSQLSDPKKDDSRPRQIAGEEGGKAERAPAQDSQSLHLELTIQTQQICGLKRGRAPLCPLPHLQITVGPFRVVTQSLPFAVLTEPRH